MGVIGVSPDWHYGKAHFGIVGGSGFLAPPLGGGVLPICRHFVATLVHEAGNRINRGSWCCHNPLIIKKKCSKEDSNLHGLPH
jgi:hypothetical protein